MNEESGNVNPSPIPSTTSSVELRMASPGDDLRDGLDCRYTESLEDEKEELSPPVNEEAPVST